MGKKSTYATLHNPNSRPVSVLGQEIAVGRYLEVNQKEFEDRTVQELLRKRKLRYNLVTAEASTPEVEEEASEEQEEDKKPAVKKARAKSSTNSD